MPVKGENSLYYDVGFNTEGVISGINDIMDLVGNMSKELGKLNPFVGLAAGLILAFGKVSREAYKFAQEFETSMKKVQVVSDRVQENFEGISQRILEISKLNFVKPTVLADAYIGIVKAGYDGEKGLKVLADANKLAAAAVEEVEDATTSLIKVMQAYHADVEKSSQYTEILYHIIRDGDTTLKEFAKGIADVAPLAAKLNIPFEELAVALELITKQGVPTDTAMKQIKETIQILNKYLTEGWQGSITFAEGLQILYDKAGGSEKELLKLVKSQKAVNSVFALAGERLKETEKHLKDYAKLTGNIDDTNKNLAKTTEEKWAILGRTLATSTFELGKFWNRFSGDLATWLNNLVKTEDVLEQELTKNISAMQEMVGKLNNAKVSLEEKENVIDDLVALYPQYLGFLDEQETSEKTLAERIDLVNEKYEVLLDAMKQRRALAAYDDSVNNAREDLIDASTAFNRELADMQQAFKRFNEEIIKWEEETGKSFDFRLGFIVDDEQAQAEIDRLEKFLEENAEDLYGSFASIIGLALTTGTTTGLDVQTVFGNLSAAQKKLNEAEAEFLKNKKAREQANIQYLSMTDNVKELEIALESINTLEGLRVFDDITGPNNKIVETKRQLLLLEKTIKQLPPIVIYEEDQKTINAIKNGLGLIDKEHEKMIEKWILQRKTYFETGFAEDEEELKKRREKAEREYERELDNKHGLYETYKTLLINGETELAARLKEGYNLEFANYQEYLRDKLKSTKNLSQELAIAERLERIDYDEELDRVQSLYEQRAQLTKDELMSYNNDMVQEFDRLYQLDYENWNTYLLKRYETATTMGEKIAIALRLKDAEDLGEKRAKELATFEEGNLINILKSENENKYKQDEQIYQKHQDQIFGITKDTQERIKKLREDEDSFSLMSQRELKEARAWRKQELAALTGVSTAEAKKYKKELNSELLEIASLMEQGSIRIVDQATQGLRGAAELFRKFGEEDIAGLFDQLAGIGDGIMQIMQGNWVGGAFTILNSAISVKIESDTADIEEDIERLSSSVRILGEQIERTLGVGRLRKNLEYLELLKQKEIDYIRAINAEMNARESTYFLGIRIGRGSPGSGTDPERLRELQEAAEAAATEVYNLMADIRELYTGATIDSIGEALLEQFELAEQGAADFAATFEDLIKNALVNSFKVSFLEEAIAPWLDKFAEFADNAGAESIPTFNEWLEAQYGPDELSRLYRAGEYQAINALQDTYNRYINELNDLSNRRDGIFDLTPEEIASLQGDFREIVEQGQSRLAALNEILSEAGIAGGLFGEAGEDGRPDSLAGSIQNITEETAEILAGTLNAIRIDVREAYLNGIDALNELRRIGDNTEYNRYLESMEARLTNIETALT